MNIERDRFIFEKLNPGKCWHEDSMQNGTCPKCGEHEKVLFHGCINPDLTTAEGFQKVWGWMRKDGDLWVRFLRWFKDNVSENIAYDCYHFFNLIDSPDNFADAVWGFLKTLEGKG